MHTILGAGGPVANALALELIKNDDQVRLVSRRPVTISDKATWLRADLLNSKEVLTATKGSEVIYLCAGLKYDKEVWKEQWPVIMKNVIDATKESGARLIFFDNVYMYGRVQGPMTEETPYNPSSEKGEVRAKIATALMDEVKAGNLNATIARAADFYGATDSMNSFFDMMVLDKYSKKQKAQWLGNPDTLHSFIYIPDAAKGVFLLGQRPESGNQIWHLPTAPAMKGYDFINLAADIFSVKPSFMKVNNLMLRTLGLFNPVIKGTVEMYYQYEYDYNVDSSKFGKAFSVNPTSYRDGIQHLANTFYKAK
ncbi:nucleoside-diphosphate-sugar epimerase [Arcticibacter tournemirensis]|uniref:NAD-dependent epimerase/dehydratase family protein n=1 Tax=Arcticibacter tournemirensis TaxID=699437 RepID=A0A5M9HED7_9SPHI|nr:NAD-dependent epimerase/dehydratase family protein [Arcticibacter tournemirensis]KAA8485063.1 NAD-dependent epimerase/dehydratase family protein [Arcticibacter tournemirensis]TQM50477.1 nucleoside-diphosphate-sugar epimerase [Arcticibacter tournemirensis]